MGSQIEEGSKSFITKEEAAYLLGCTTRSVYRYIDKGWLETTHRGRLIGTTKESVAFLKERLDAEVSPYKVAIQNLESRLLLAESRIATLMRLMNLRVQPLNLTDPEIVSYYMMIDHCSKTGWPPHNEEMFINNFQRIQQNDLDQLERMTGDEHPWLPFLLLATTMRATLYNKQLQADIEFATGHLTAMANLWCRAKGETVKTLDILMARGTRPLKKLINRIERDKQKTRTPGEA